MTRVLVVDDNAQVRTTARILLEAAGFQVVEAESGEAALEVLSSEAVEAVVCDVCMCPMDPPITVRCAAAYGGAAPVPPQHLMRSGTWQVDKTELKSFLTFGV